MTAADLQAYLREASRKPAAISFKRFVRFLAETGRREDEHLEEFRQVLKQTEADLMRG